VLEGFSQVGEVMRMECRKATMEKWMGRLQRT